ncbi:TIGR00725 family protein [Oceanibaculum nanhaiense]|uniref:TIGR00725 family protein n=1 Tax=Oceanibaculum nanhaiense TaxID=1909734 RepID=UPI00396F06A4
MTDSTLIFYSPSEAALYRAGQRFDGWAHIWQAAASLPGDLMPVTPVEALFRIARLSGTRQLPVGVLGPREASPAQYALAEALGQRLGEAGLTLICGGRSGVMEAVCKGCLEAGGRPIGILPDEEWRQANPYVAVPLATGLGSARNAVIARAAPVLVAIGGGYGTLSEIAFGLRFGRLVLTLLDAPVVEGCIPCADIATAMDCIAAHMLKPGKD